MNVIREQLPYTLDKFDIPNIGKHYKGKVRENFHMGDEILMVTTDRVSAFDHVLGTIPFKGQILTEIANFVTRLAQFEANLKCRPIVDHFRLSEGGGIA